MLRRLIASFPRLVACFHTTCSSPILSLVCSRSRSHLLVSHLSTYAQGVTPSLQYKVLARVSAVEGQHHGVLDCSHDELDTVHVSRIFLARTMWTER